MSVDRRTFLKLAAAAAAAGCGHSGPPPRVASQVSYRRLALDIEHLAPAYDVVVVGSGYGGSVMAARLAAGRKVALLERGAEWAPGAFPETLGAMTSQLRTAGQPLGLYDLRAFKDVSVVLGNGLGGTSLINANVVIQPDDDLFDRDGWPDEIRRERDSGRMAELFAEVTRMLQAAPYPGDSLAKLIAFQRGVRTTDGRYYRATQAVNFDRYDGVANHVGVVQAACTLCGNCVSGCNVSAKNTLNFNYLPLARQYGAEIFTGVEVTRIEKLASGGYAVHAVHHPGSIPGGAGAGGDKPGAGSRAVTIGARAVVLGAGSLGSTEILLRSRAAGLRVSDALGQGVSGNADLLAVAYNSDLRTDVVGFGTKQFGYAAVGPTIAAIGDFRHGGEVPLAERFLIEEAAIPSGLAGVVRHVIGMIPVGDAAARTSDQEEARVERNLSDIGSFDPDGAINHSIVLLGMGNDSATARLRLDADGKLTMDWYPGDFGPMARRIIGKMREVSEGIGGILVVDPLSRGWLDRDITVHPLGGCGMAADSRRGVVDHLGRVFDPGAGATAVHDGLYVADGAILPTSAGVNPLLTISALAERIAARAGKDLPRG